MLTDLPSIAVPRRTLPNQWDSSRLDFRLRATPGIEATSFSRPAAKHQQPLRSQRVYSYRIKRLALLKQLNEQNHVAARYLRNPQTRDACATPATFQLGEKVGRIYGCQLADTNFTKLTPIDQLFVIIRVIRVFTRLRLKGATAWQAAAFPRRVFGNADRRAKGPRSDRA